MEPIRTSDLERELRRKGFEGVPHGGHMWYYLTFGGKRTGFHMHRSLRDLELHDGRIRQMAKELKVSPHEIWGLHDCDLDQQGLIDYLRAKGFTI